MRAHSIYSDPKPKRRRSYASLDSDGGKPCPTCYAQMYAQMTLDGKTQWMCAKHGEPSKP